MLLLAVSRSFCHHLRVARIVALSLESRESSHLPSNTLPVKIFNLAPSSTAFNAPGHQLAPPVKLSLTPMDDNLNEEPPLAPAQPAVLFPTPRLLLSLRSSRNARLAFAPLVRHCEVAGLGRANDVIPVAPPPPPPPLPPLDRVGKPSGDSPVPLVPLVGRHASPVAPDFPCRDQSRVGSALFLGVNRRSLRLDFIALALAVAPNLSLLVGLYILPCVAGAVDARLWVMASIGGRNTTGPSERSSWGCFEVKRVS